MMDPDQRMKKAQRAALEDYGMCPTPGEIAGVYGIEEASTFRKIDSGGRR